MQGYEAMIEGATSIKKSSMPVEFCLMSARRIVHEKTAVRQH